MLFEMPLDGLISFMLVFFRMGGLLVSMPVIGGRGIPARFKVLLAMLMTALLLPVLPPAALASTEGSPWQLLGLVFHETLFGLMLGLLAQIPIWAAQLAGHLIGLQMGLGIASILDPESGGQESLPASFLRNCALIFFLMIGGHHILIETLAKSFALVPPGAINLSVELFDEGMRLSALVLDLALRLGAPAMAALLLSEAGLGLIARTVPQMNIFIVGFPLKIALGLGLVAISLPAFAILFQQSYARLATELELIVALVVP